MSVFFKNTLGSISKKKVKIKWYTKKTEKIYRLPSRNYTAGRPENLKKSKQKKTKLDKSNK